MSYSGLQCGWCKSWVCRCGCGLTLSDCGSILPQQQHSHWQEANRLPGILGAAVFTVSSPEFPGSRRHLMSLLTEQDKALFYKALYDDGMRIDRAMWIVKEAR